MNVKMRNILRFTMALLLSLGSMFQAESQTLRFIPKEQYVCGAQDTDNYLHLLENKRVGVVANQTSLIGETHLVDSLVSLGINVKRIFTPEHGFRGAADAGAKVTNGKDEKTGIEIASLYGKTKKPTDEMLRDIDIMLFDLQDVGVRFYTYISTLSYVMEACAENDIRVVVLDCPNPNGFYIDGPILKAENNLRIHAAIGTSTERQIIHGIQQIGLTRPVMTDKTVHLGRQRQRCLLNVLVVDDG